VRAREKPHLRYAGGVWSCAQYRKMPTDGIQCWFSWRIGMGYSVREAWNDYLAQEFA